MKANELMIGDWVMVNDMEHTHPLQVAEIFKKSGAYYATLYWDGMPDNVNPETLTADVDKVLPIPLTPEILEKNGFQYFHKNFCSLSYDHPFQFEMKQWPDENGLGGLWAICDIIEIRFVHQLQHTLKLCGIEKEIEL